MIKTLFLNPANLLSVFRIFLSIPLFLTMNNINDGSSIFISEKQTTLLGKTGVKFYLNKRFDFRVEFFQKAFFAPTGLSSSSLRLKSDLNFSLGVTF